MRPGAQTPVNKVLNTGPGTAAGRLLVPPSGPGRSHPGPSLYQDPQNAASELIRARFQLIYCKVSQNRIVSPKFMQKACHSPYIQNGPQKSPLEIPRFLFSVAFSHKELMVPFCRTQALYCQNDEVSTDVHTLYHAKCTSDTPTGHRRQAAPGDPLLI